MLFLEVKSRSQYIMNKKITFETESCYDYSIGNFEPILLGPARVQNLIVPII